MLRKIAMLVVMLSACGGGIDKKGSPPEQATDGRNNGEDVVDDDDEQPNDPATCTAFGSTMIDFGVVDEGASQTVAFTNCADTAVEITAIDVEGAGFWLSSSMVLPLILEQGADTMFGVEFLPEAPGPALGVARVTTSAGVHELPLSARTDETDEACPVPVAYVSRVDSNGGATSMRTDVGTVVRLSGVDSVGDIAEYEWTVTRPNGSESTMVPAATVPEPTFLLDRAGQYRFSLRVYGERETAGCGQAATVVVDAATEVDVVTPGENQLEIELFWDTPGDLDQSDASGTDLDLHLLHPNGAWNNVPWDCFWNNRKADWGAPGEVGDPELVLDDQDGLGPERLVMKSGAESTTYAVGVYYYATAELGPSFARIRVKVDGQLTYESPERALNAQNEFWYPVTITFPTGVVGVVDRVTPGFPNQ